MADQRERHSQAEGVAILESAIGGPLPTGSIVSGGQIENFRRGWARAIDSSGDHAHFFIRDRFDGARALCGFEASARWLYGAGNYPQCSRCRKVKQRMRIN